MNGEESKKYIKNINDSYKKIIQDELDESKKKKDLKESKEKK
jgi:hypothetical protein